MQSSASSFPVLAALSPAWICSLLHLLEAKFSFEGCQPAQLLVLIPRTQLTFDQPRISTVPCVIWDFWDSAGLHGAARIPRQRRYVLENIHLDLGSISCIFPFFIARLIFYHQPL